MILEPLTFDLFPNSGDRILDFPSFVIEILGYPTSDFIGYAVSHPHPRASPTTDLAKQGVNYAVQDKVALCSGGARGKVLWRPNSMPARLPKL